MLAQVAAQYTVQYMSAYIYMLHVLATNIQTSFAYVSCENIRVLCIHICTETGTFVHVLLQLRSTVCNKHKNNTTQHSKITTREYSCILYVDLCVSVCVLEIIMMLKPLRRPTTKETPIEIVPPKICVSLSHHKVKCRYIRTGKHRNARCYATDTRSRKRCALVDR